MWCPHVIGLMELNARPLVKIKFNLGKAKRIIELFIDVYFPEVSRKFAYQSFELNFNNGFGLIRRSTRFLNSHKNVSQLHLLGFLFTIFSDAESRRFNRLVKFNIKFQLVSSQNTEYNLPLTRGVSTL